MIRLLTFSIFILLIIIFFAFPKESKTAFEIDDPITKKVWVVEYDPRIPSQGNKRISELVRANDPHTLVDTYINELKSLSGNYITYQIAGWTERDEVAPLDNTDGFEYTKDGFWNCYINDVPSNPACHELESERHVDYLELISDNSLCSKSNNGTLDEVWFFDPGHMGFYEAIMAGPFGLYYVNGSPVTTQSCQKHMQMMGFNYTRTTTEMRHSFSHRVEGTLSHEVFDEDPRHYPYPHNTNWGKFMANDYSWPNNARCGNLHFPPNALGNYGNGEEFQYSLTTYVQSACDNFYDYPSLPNPPVFTNINCTTWGCNENGFINWWLEHLPKFKGMNNPNNPKFNNWWRYIVNFNLCPAPVMNNATHSCTDVGQASITWSWSQIEGTTSYTFGMDDTNPFVSPLLVNTTTTTNSITTPPRVGGTYYGKARVNTNTSGTCIAPGMWSATKAKSFTCP